MSFGNITITGSSGKAEKTPLMSFFKNVEQPGTDPYYNQCKIIYAYHPLGKVVVDKIIELAFSQERKIIVNEIEDSPVVQQFKKTYQRLNADRFIKQVLSISRIYGAGTLVIDAGEGEDTSKKIDYAGLAKQNIKFKVFDPLVTSGSMSTNQDPNDPNFQGMSTIEVRGKTYHHSRSCTVMNEDPLYLLFTTSAFGFTGRSVYQRVLYNLKAYLQSIQTDFYVLEKAGMRILTSESTTGQVVDAEVVSNAKLKAQNVKDSTVENVVSLSGGQTLTSFDLASIESCTKNARDNILKDIATGTNQPASIINQETLASGFGEGSEDAKSIARAIDGYRIETNSIFEFIDKIIMYKAWNEEFFETLKRTHREYEKVTYEEAFNSWVDTFEAKWPNLLTEPDSEKVKVEEVKLRAAISMFDAIQSNLDPENKTKAIDWLSNVFNECDILSRSTSLEIDKESLLNYTPPELKTPSPSLSYETYK